MDPFTQKILQKAEQRSKILGVSNISQVDMNEFENIGVDEFANETSKDRDRQLHSKSTADSSNITKYTMDKENVDVGIEISIKTKPNIEIQLEVDDQTNSSLKCQSPDKKSAESIKLSEISRHRLQRLGALYSNADILSSPIHKTENKFYEESSESCDSHNKRPQQKIGKLAALADSINCWEDDLTHFIFGNKSEKSASKRQDDTAEEKLSEDSSSKCTKQLKWDKNVIDSLEAQGFQRRESTCNLRYDYTKGESSSTKTCHSPSSKDIGQARSGSVLSEIKSGLVSNRTAIFESKPDKCSPKQIDPVEMPLKERMKLFERNKGEIPLPKNTFVSSRMPSKPKFELSKSKSEALKPGTPKKGLVTSDVTIKEKIAMLSGCLNLETQSNSDDTRESKDDVSALVNRFDRKKEDDITMQQKKPTVPPSPPSPPPMPSSIIQEHVDAKCTIKNKRRSPGVATYNVKAESSDDFKRFKVNANTKSNTHLYPILPSLESMDSLNDNCTTATISTSTDDKYRESELNKSDESYMDSDKDEGIAPFKLSLQREVLNAFNTNRSKEEWNPENVSVTSSASSGDIDNYLDEALDEDELSSDDECRELPTPNKNKNEGTTSSNSFSYKKIPKTSSFRGIFPKENKNQVKFSDEVDSEKRLKSELTVKSNDDNVVTLVHTVSFYRRQQSSNSNNPTPVKKIYRDQTASCSSKNNHKIYEEDTDDSSLDKAQEAHMVQEKIKKLLDEVCKQQQVIAQTSQALNLCASTIEFSGSTEAVEGERHLLVATHRRQAALDEIQRLNIEKTLRPVGAPVEKGHLSVREIMVPLKDDYIKKLSEDAITGHHLVCLLKYGEIVLATRTVPTLPGLLSVKFPDVLTFNQAYADFKITLEIYGMTAQREILPHEVKYHINAGKKFGQRTPKKKGTDSLLVMPKTQSPAGPHVVRTPALVQYGFAIFSLREIKRDTWTLTQTSGVSPLKGIVQMKVNCELSVSIVYKGFLTMFEDTNGFGAWHRRWCYLNGNLLKYWKYPNDEKQKQPMGCIDLNSCTTSKVTVAPRDICTRLNTLLLECQRPAKDTDEHTLLVTPRGKMTIVKHLLCADTKEERDEWCAYFNKALTLLRIWNTQQ